MRPAWISIATWSKKISTEYLIMPDYFLSRRPSHPVTRPRQNLLVRHHRLQIPAIPAYFRLAAGAELAETVRKWGTTEEIFLPNSTLSTAQQALSLHSSSPSLPETF